MLSLLLQPIEKVINAYLRLDPAVGELLTPLSGKTILVTMQGMPFSCVFLGKADCLELITSCASPDAKIICSPMAAVGFNSEKLRARALAEGQIQVEGDTECANHFSDLFLQLDIDWEAHLADYLGDALAHKFAHFFKILNQWREQTMQTLQQNASEYIQEECVLSPPRQEVEDFYDEVDALRARTDRLQMKLKRAQKNQETSVE